ncbi:hypothetical protein D0Y65_054605 [Glycine soja]|uniref:Uncharacterized protein n=1 Tax=Glycine soja TaxID=3848 RepID=A0A445F7F6_GLYSO|nr:hypothetical protein D0Y65_054605 [Glycine soja]
MVVKMMSWPTWPPLSSKKFEVVFIVHRLEGSSSMEKDELASMVRKVKGELLLKKHGEEGGDDIDHDRRLLSSSDDYTSGKVIKCKLQLAA